ncbi:trans-resveratrol di-O-methyltransferase-like [Cocos nucifera]|uniref:Trans-resveratrol di-O-methyltransferase-like n=1 Tax=Cocos nucifera TaxID=13894 RepID=A0A8K0MYZ1_COCNU|nr:trans-resveratrol di-O-methyltransferase-like [Cocos nucifera]
MSLNCAVELRIADLIHSHGGPMPLSELARSIPIPPEKAPSLRRLMRLLVSHGVFAVQPDGNSHENESTAYLLTPLSELLLTKGTNLSPFIRANSDPSFLKPWFHMGEWFKRKGSTPLEVAYDVKSVWDLTEQRPELNDKFNDAMSCETFWVMKTMVTEFPQFFRGLKSLVDVGGGTGASATMIAEAFPDVKCTVFDLPHVVAALPESKLVDAVGGSMFDSIPPADAVFLKSILHNWSDEDCVKILKRCKEAVPQKEEGGKVIIVDMVINSDDAKVTETHLFYDICMMIALGGMEREEHEWRKIFNNAGFTDYKIFPILGVYSVIELYP